MVLESPPLVFVRHHLANQTSSDTCNNKDNTLPTTDSTKSVYGFVVDFLCQLELQLHLSYKITIAESNISYDDLVLSVDREKREYDMVFAAIRITSRRLALVDFSTSIYEHTLLIVTRPEPGSRSLNLFSFLNPFTISVWIAILGTMLYTGGLVYVFEREQVTFQHPHSRIGSICLGMCRVMTSVIIMSGEVRLTRNASRLTVLGLYGLGAILMATYTANLSSCLILNRPQPFISSIADIKSGRIPFDRIGIVTNSAIWDYYVDNVKQQYYPLSSTDEMYASLLNHTIDAAIWTSPVLEYAVAHEYCGKLVTVPTGFLKSPFAIALPKNWNHRRELDWNILNMRESQTLEKIEDRWFEHQKCSLDRRYSPDNELNGIGKVSFDIMIGIFLFFAMITFVAIGINAWDSWVGFAVAIRRTIRRIII